MWVTGGSAARPVQEEENYVSCSDLASQDETDKKQIEAAEVKQVRERTSYHNRVTAGFKDTFIDSEVIPDELDCKCCEGGSHTNPGSKSIPQGTRCQEHRPLETADLIKQAHPNLNQFNQMIRFGAEGANKATQQALLSESDVYSPYGIVDDSLLN